MIFGKEHPSVSRAVESYCALLDRHAPDLVAALYVHGSIGLNAFVKGRSDVDVIAVLGRDAGDRDVDALELIHRKLVEEHSSPDWDGNYLRWDDLGRPVSEVVPHPFYHDGKLFRSGRYNLHPVTWWMLKQHSVTVFGPPAASLAFTVAWDDVRAYMIANLKTYWTSWTTSREMFTELLTDEGV